MAKEICAESLAVFICSYICFMDQLSTLALERFKDHVGIKFQLYNSLFTSLPFHRIEKTGILLSLFLNHCEESYRRNLSPALIVDEFFTRYTTLRKEAGCPTELDSRSTS